MPIARPALLAATFLAASAAQAQPLLPSPSRSESQATRLNNGLVEQDRARGVQQQNQSEINSLRNELSRPAPIVAPPPVVIVR